MNDQKINLMICTPVHGDVKLEYVKSLLDLMEVAPRFKVKVYPPYFPTGSAIHQQRNFGLAKFLKDPELTHLLYVDSDIKFNSTNVFKLLAYDKEFSGIAYRAKGDTFTGFNIYAPDTNQRCTATGMIKVDGFGGGFMMIKRSVIEKMAAAYPQYKCLGFPHLSNEHQAGLNDYYYNLFDWGVNPRTNYILSEDFTFCHRWRAIGGDVWADATQGLGHIGNKNYYGKLMDNIVDNKFAVLRQNPAIGLKQSAD